MKRKHTLENNYPPQLKAKFLERLQKYNLPGLPDECWEWQGSKAFYGYGSILYEGGLYRTHRVAWEVYHSPIPDKMCVLHKCDNPKCVNPSHLFIGTQSDNMKDRDKKGRGNQVGGTKHYKSKFTLKQIKQIRELYATGRYDQYALADMYECHQPTICRIVRKETYK